MLLGLGSGPEFQFYFFLLTALRQSPLSISDSPLSFSSSSSSIAPLFLSTSLRSFRHLLPSFMLCFLSVVVLVLLSCSHSSSFSHFLSVFLSVCLSACLSRSLFILSLSLSLSLSLYCMLPISESPVKPPIAPACPLVS